ncbi:uncharacterized protein LOC131323663 [Rhododendron vialii]|uniref:uncharacterized protein LOC131323663 n=1 Tax=Rhododendron vialii TaxID=182163 RepID=UPI00265EAD32|nr:uncharacterized protein LOC131323663 [Rhododendron vialii]
MVCKRAVEYLQEFLSANSLGPAPWCASSLVAEALAIRQGILLGSQLSLGSVILESDAQLLMNMLNGQAAVSQEVEVVTHDVQVLSNNFHCCSFSFVRRTVNNVAHVLADEGFCGLGYSCWTESPPLWLLDPLSRDESSV